MCLRNERIAIVIAVLLTATLAASRSAFADDVSTYLEQHGLKQLLVIYLEQQLETASADQKGELTLKLASLYAEMLESTTDAAQHASLEDRSRKLLESVPANSSAELRLALLRNQYRSAEKIAENHRLRLSTPVEIETAKKSFAELVPQLSELRQLLKDQADVTDRRLGRAAGAEAISLQQTLDKQRGLVSQASFVTAWAMYYQAWLGGQRDSALFAEALFAEIMGVESKHPEPQDVPMDSRSAEWMARSILGVALCKSISASPSTAQAWLDLLEQPIVFEPVRIQVTAWRLCVHLESRHYGPALEILRERHTETGEMPIAWIRLAAAQALDDPNHTDQANDLAHFAVLELAARGELGQIIDLANRYGVDALGGSGFALQYVRGMIKYQHAREVHEGDQPTTDAEKAKLYQDAAASLKAAIVEADVDKFAVPAASCRRLIAWCAYFQGQYLEAKDLFKEAAANLDPIEAPEAAWMAIVCLDRLVQSSDNPSLRTEQSMLIDQFLAKYPSNEHAAKLVLKRALAVDDVSPRAANDLLSVPPGSDVYPAAQRRAADILYQLYRDASGQQKVSYGRQYLGVAIGLIEEASSLSETSEPSEVQRVIARCRRVLEIALSDGIDDASAARQALQAIDELAKLPKVDLRDHSAELDFRRAQERLLAGDVDAAAAIAEKLWNSDAESLWSRLAARAMFKFGQRQWKDSEATAEEQRRGVELVDKYGGRVLREYADDPVALDQANVLAYHAAVAEASMKLWEENGDEKRGRAALFLFEKLLAKKPRTAPFLRSTAILAEQFGTTDRALECWRSLASGSPQASDGWYEAKFRLISLLVATDLPRARQVMDQHKQLYPTFGPDPWGGRLRGLDELINTKLNNQSSAATSPAQSEPQPSSPQSAPSSP